MGFQKGHKDFVPPSARKSAGIKNRIRFLGRPLSEETKKKLRESQRRRVQMGLGCKGHSEETRLKIGASKKGKPGRIQTEEVRLKISKAMKGRKHTEESKERMRVKAVRSRGRISKKDTRIERLFEDALNKSGVGFQKQVPLCGVAVVDFFIPESRTVIQCDGDYWHNLPGVKERDRKQDAVLSANGFQVFRFWEHEINVSAEDCLNRITSN